MAGHTPTPWRLGDPTPESQSGIVASVYTCEPDPWHIADVSGRPDDPAPVCGRGNAEFIVRACNSHAALVAILTKLARYKVGPTQANRGKWVDTMLGLAEEARAALALAKGEESS